MDDKKQRIHERRLNRIRQEHQAQLDSGTAPFKIPKVFSNASLEDFNSSKYPKGFVEFAKQKAKSKESWYLMGTFGAGKSRFVYAYAKYLFLELGVRQVNVIRFSDIYKHVGMHFGEFKESDRFKELKSCSTLIIDDIRRVDGKNENQFNSFVDLLDARIENDLTTIFTSNLAPTKIAEGNDRITSRFARMLKDKKNVKVFKQSFVKDL